MSVVLMYHALHADDDLSKIDIEDQPYAVSESTFAEHLDILKDFSVGLLSEDPSAEQPQIVITFDDGHISNYELALPMLQAAGMKAYFFVTTHFIDNREHFCRPAMLKEFTEAGMVIGSHGVSHQFLADLPRDDAKYELVHSRKTLQQWLGEPISTISYPGGRYTADTMIEARSAGYRQIFDSTFDVVSASAIQSQSALARVAIRRSTTLEDFRSMVGHDKQYYRKIQRKQQFKQTIKKLLGNRLYHGLYKSITAHR